MVNDRPNLPNRTKTQAAGYRIAAVIRQMDLDLTEVETMQAIMCALLIRTGPTVPAPIIAASFRNMADVIGGSE